VITEQLKVFSRLNLPKLIRAIKSLLVELHLLPLTMRIRKPSSQFRTLIPRSHYYEGERLGRSITNVSKEYLLDSGWVESKTRNASIKNGRYIPWITYPAFDFLDRLNLENFSIVEFGAGASTIYFSERCKNLISYEFDRNYFLEIEKLNEIFPNTKILLFDAQPIHSQKKEGDFVSTFIDSELEQCILKDEKIWPISVGTILTDDFLVLTESAILNSDLIFIDGGPRNTLIALVSRYVKSGTIIVVDNSNQEHLSMGLLILKTKGFIEIPFAGLAPLSHFKSQTSLFIKDIDALKMH